MLSKSKTNKEKNEEKVKGEKKTIITTGPHNVTTTINQTLSVHKIHQRSISVSCSATGSDLPSNSLLSLPSSLSTNFTLPFPELSSSSVYNRQDRTCVDEYKSPYKYVSPVYGNFTRTTKSTTPLAKPPITSTVPSTKFTNNQISASPIVNVNKKINVKKTGKFYDNNSNDRIPTYKTSSNNRGEVMIINNILFQDKSQREGAKVDDENLKELFKQIGMKVTVERNLKKSAMESKIESFSKKSSLKSADISVVIVMSHGTKNEYLGDTEIFGVDEKGILVEDILQHFTAAHCKNMANKPKIFIFQCCRGNNEQFVETDAKPFKKATGHADMLIAYSTLPGFVSNRHPKYGTWYIQTICDVFSQHAHEYPVEDMLKIVDVKLSSFGVNVRQISSYESRGFKRCYLHPK